MAHIKSWDRFSKWKYYQEDLRQWERWFTGRGIECELRRVNSMWALFVYQEWSVIQPDRGKKVLKKELARTRINLRQEK